MFEPESKAFYSKLFSIINLNYALCVSNYCPKFICEMNEHEYQEFLVRLEYLHHTGVINLDEVLGR